MKSKHRKINSRWFIDIVENDVYAEEFSHPVEDGTMKNWWRPPNQWWKWNPSKYMVHRNDGLHPAIDFWRKDGSSAMNYEIWAIGDGIVVDIVYDRETYPEKADGRDEDWGNLILVQHNYKDECNKVHIIWSLYAHCKTIEVEIGDKVKGKQRIGLVGETDGNTASRMWSPHLHFEIRKLSLSADAWPKSMGLGYWDRSVAKKEIYHHPLEFIESF